MSAKDLMVIGGGGRLGAAVVSHWLESGDPEGLCVVGRRPEAPFPQVAYDTDLAKALKEHRPGVVLDAAPGGALEARLQALEGGEGAYVLGTTGYPRSLEPRLAALARKRAVVVASNFSPGVAVLSRLLKSMRDEVDAGRWDPAIVERHHRHKVDRPSGTALSLARLLWDEMPPDKVVSLRQGEVAGEHQVLFVGTDEELVLTHRVTHRDVFARGALLAVAFAAQSGPGLWTMADVVGFPPA